QNEISDSIKHRIRCGGVIADCCSVVSVKIYLQQTEKFPHIVPFLIRKQVYGRKIFGLYGRGILILGSFFIVWFYHPLGTWGSFGVILQPDPTQTLKPAQFLLPFNLGFNVFKGLFAEISVD